MPSSITPLVFVFSLMIGLIIAVFVPWKGEVERLQTELHVERISCPFWVNPADALRQLKKGETPPRGCVVTHVK